MKRLLHKLLCYFDAHCWIAVLGEQSIKYECAHCEKFKWRQHGEPCKRVVWMPGHLWNHLVDTHGDEPKAE